MNLPNIFADYNGLVRITESPPRYSVALDTFGTVRDLSNAGIRLTEGLELLVWDESDESEDLEGEAIARFDSMSGVWWADFKPEGYRHVRKCDRPESCRFLCFACRQEVFVGTGAGGWISKTQRCHHCGTPVTAAIAPPAS